MRKRNGLLAAILTNPLMRLVARPTDSPAGSGQGTPSMGRDAKGREGKKKRSGRKERRTEREKGTRFYAGTSLCPAMVVFCTVGR